jgi:VIT1/CCC1 family predicted Fe2+/Mn2+ transporter
VSSQADSEAADLSRERRELAAEPEQELAELTNIYVGRGLPIDLARQVATHLSAEDALSAHARDELGISEHTAARPIQAALTSAATFAVGAALPLAAVAISPLSAMALTVSGASLAFLALLGAVAAKAGGAGLWKPTARVTFWGALAMAITAMIGSLFGAVV